MKPSLVQWPTNIRLYKTLVGSTLSYGSEDWPFRQKINKADLLPMK